MQLTLNEQQQQLADSVRRWVRRGYGFETRRAIVRSGSGVSDPAWATMAELGLCALPVPEAHGGFGGNAVDMYVVMQELGRGLVVEPYVATMLGAEFLRLGGGHGDLLERVARGELKLACALTERQARHAACDIATRADSAGGGVVLNGEKIAVLHGAQAGVLLVSARSGGGRDDMDGITLCAVPADAPGLRIVDCRTLDGMRAADVRFEGVAVPAGAIVGAVGAGGAILDAALDAGAGLLCAEALGAMEALFADTLDYVKARQQFGAPIGKFQALQHRMADMAIELEQARSMALLAALTLARDGVDPATRRRVVSAAKMRVDQAARAVGQGAVQLHGGMGVTDELAASHYFKRLTMIGLTLGDADHHLERFIAQPGFQEEMA